MRRKRHFMEPTARAAKVDVGARPLSMSFVAPAPNTVAGRLLAAAAGDREAAIRPEVLNDVVARLTRISGDEFLPRA